MGGVALAGALGGAVPAVVLLGPAVLGLAPVVVEGGDHVVPGLGLEDVAVERGGVDVLAGLGAGRGRGLDGGLHGLLLDVGGVALAGALGGAVPAVVLLGPAVLGLVPVVADGVEGFGLGLRLKALVRKGCGVGPLALLGAISLVHEGGLHGLGNLVAAIAALGVAGAIPAVSLLLPNVVVQVNEVVLVLTVGVVVG